MKRKSSLISSLIIVMGLIASLVQNTNAQTALIATPCPNDCNSNGLCLKHTRQCQCFKGWTGYDCSLKTCPFGPAWTDFAIATDDAHNMAECSNMGTCDRAFGTCSCQIFFEGDACQRNSCPNACNGRGKCLSMRNYAASKDPGSISGVFTYQNVWDAEMLHGCLCDAGFEGPDCSLMMCPVGDDPLTGVGIPTAANPTQYNDKQQITCAASSGQFTLTYLGKTTQPINYNAKIADVTSALTALVTIGTTSAYPAVGMVKVIVTMPTSAQACLPAGAIWYVEFQQQFGPLNFLVVNKYTLANGQVAATLSIQKKVTGSKENAFCSNRGICDESTGRCTCSLSFDSSNGYGAIGTRGDCGYPVTTIQYCPGTISCSGHGNCNGSPTYTCSCQIGWTGADCSLRLCPSGPSWFTYPSATDVAHVFQNTECSSMGICDRITGLCACVQGFSGDACQYHNCPGTIESCNGKGACHDMSTLASLATVNGVNGGFTYGATPGNALTWDANRLFGCACDPTYAGYDCSLRTCPPGDDPLSINQADEIQLITCQDADLSGTVLFSFRDVQGVAIQAQSTSAQIKAALQAIYTVGLVSVEPWAENGVDQMCTAAGNQMMVTFKTEHGDLPLIQFTPSAIDTFFITEHLAGTKEMIECSGRGNCNRVTGVCSCFLGFGSSDGMGGQGVLGDCGYQEPVLTTYA